MFQLNCYTDNDTYNNVIRIKKIPDYSLGFLIAVLVSSKYAVEILFYSKPY